MRTQRAGAGAGLALLLLACAVARTSATQSVSCIAAMVIEDHMAYRQHPNTAILAQADGPPGSGAQGGWTLERCQSACTSHGVRCSMLSYSPQKETYTSAGYCELWGPGHNVSAASKLQGVHTYTNEGTDAFGFLACELTNGTTLMFEEEHPDTSFVKTGDHLQLEIAEKPAEATFGGARRKKACNRQACQRKQWSIRAMRNPTRLARERKDAGHEHGHEHGRGRRAVRDGPRSMLMINVRYLGSGGDPSSYCGEGCMSQNAWTGQGTLDGMIRESSYGKVQFPQSQGRVVSVSVNQYITSQFNCPVEQMKNAADQQLTAMGITPTSYDHRVYYIPDSTPGCAWAGLAYVGGGVSWMKHANPTLFAHEIGHNLGLHHASLDTNNDGASESEYGDHSAIMGNDLAWRGLLGANRYSLGWLPSSSVFEWDRSCASNAVGQVKIHALTQPLGFGGAYAVMRFPRSSGGNYFVSLRANEGYDRTMNTRWRDQVQVKYMVGTRTYHVKALPNGQQFTDGGIRIKVNAISGSVATVQMCDSGITQPDSGSNSNSGGGNNNNNNDGNNNENDGNTGSNTGCADTHGSACQYWANIGECQANPLFMLPNCAKSCNQCNPDPPADTTIATTASPTTSTGCTATRNKAIMGEADGPAGSGKAGGWTLARCTQTCTQSGRCSIAIFSQAKTPYTTAGYCELWGRGHSTAELVSLEGIDAYMCASSGSSGGNTGSNTPTDAPPPAGACKDNNPSCSAWAEWGECDRNPGYMVDQCQKSCKTCSSGSNGGGTEGSDDGPETEPQSGSGGNCDFVHSNRAIFGSADAGGSGSESWSLAQCKQACRDSKICIMATHTARKTQWTPAGYCELWSGSHSATELQFLEGFNTYVCSQSKLGVSPKVTDSPGVGASTTTQPPVATTPFGTQKRTCKMRDTCSDRDGATNRGRRPRKLPDTM